MKWRGRRQSSRVDDRRGMSRGKKTTIGGGILGLIIMAALSYFGGDNAAMLKPVVEQALQGREHVSTSKPLSKKDVEMGQFVATVFADCEDVWTKIFAQAGSEYPYPTMVLFRDGVSSGCGEMSSAVGPFYCPADQKIYMDLSFFEELKRKFGAKGGDFAIAYVIAHEVGHHIQNVLGTNRKVRQAQQGMSKARANRLSVAMELQADFYAGVWSHYNQQYLDKGDIEEALSAAQAVGDDAIQSKMSGRVNPESFTHGTSKQRMDWFMRGYESGDINEGNTFDYIN